MKTSLLRQLEELTGAVDSIKPLAEQGATSVVQKVTAERGGFIVKSAYQKRYRGWLKEEASVLQRLTGQCDIPVPLFYGFFEDEKESHLLMSYEEGITLTAALQQSANLADKEKLLINFGQLIRKLHATDPAGLFAAPDNWLEDQLEEAKRYLEQGETDGNERLYKRIAANRPAPIRQTIIHGDCTTDNVLVYQGKCRYFIDVGGMTVGDPRYDQALAIRKFIDNEKLTDAFYDGYTTHIPRVTQNEYEYFEMGLYEFF